MKKSLGAKIIVFPTPVWVIGTYDDQGKPNIAAVAWGGVCCSQPPCLAISLRKATYSHGNIVARKAFTINVPSEDYVEQADYCGLVSGRNVDKFTAAGLTAVKGEIVDAPYIAEFPLIIECKLLHTIELGLHTQFVGEIMEVKAEETTLGEDGAPIAGKIRPVIFAPEEHAYYSLGPCLGPAFTLGKKLKEK
jgi:flavin reductase (DIM6/NTAB) family NADH-FMN oxidoreductase RutF